MKIIVTDCDHDKMVQEEEVFARAGMTLPVRLRTT